MAHDIEITGLMKDTGLGLRILQHWTTLSILHADSTTDRLGRGYRRTFKAPPPYYGERAFALVAAALNRLRIPQADMKTIVDDFRREMDGPKAAFTPIARALAGELIFVVIAIDSAGNVHRETVLREPSLETARDPKTWGPEFTGDGTTLRSDGIVELNMSWYFASKYVASCLLNLTTAFSPLRGKG